MFQNATPPQPDSATGQAKPRAAQATGTITHLLTLGRIHLLTGEILPLLGHRHTLALYLGVLFILIALDPTGIAALLPIEQRGGILVISIGLFVGLLTLMINTPALLGRKGPIHLHMSPLLLVAALCSVTVFELLVRTVTVSPNDTFLRLMLLVFFHYIFSEFAVAIFAHTLLPQIIGELRGLPIRKLAETDPDLWARAAAVSSDDGTRHPAPPPSEGFLETTGGSFSFASLLHLRAEGNYVHVWAQGRHELVTGPLADLVGQLPQTLGRQVHRSHWVALHALRQWQADGREITLHLSNGQSVPVAVTRRREVRDWLTAISLPRSGAE